MKLSKCHLIDRAKGQLVLVCKAATCSTHTHAYKFINIQPEARDYRLFRNTLYYDTTVTSPEEGNYGLLLEACIFTSTTPNNIMRWCVDTGPILAFIFDFKVNLPV